MELFVEPWNVASLVTTRRTGYVVDGRLPGEEVRGRRVDLVRLVAGRP